MKLEILIGNEGQVHRKSVNEFTFAIQYKLTIKYGSKYIVVFELIEAETEADVHNAVAKLLHIERIYLGYTRTIYLAHILYNINKL